MNIALNLPINRVSFGQVSTLLLKTLFEQEQKGIKHNVFLFPIGNVDLGSQFPDEPFNNWLKEKIKNGLENYSREIPVFRLWHLNGSMESVSNKPNLLSFYELDEPTKIELNVAKNNKTFFSSKYSCEIFRQFGVETNYLPLAFDSYNFQVKTKKVHDDDRIVFNVCGKFEKRKHHEKVIQAWIKKYGNDSRYALQCAIYNPFLGRNTEECNANNHQTAVKIVNNKKPFNVGFYPLMSENLVYNEFLNSADIILGLSGAEGFGLPEFQSIALGKHAVLLKAHAYKDWATDDMVSWVNPSGKIPAYDGFFFQQGQPFNQGNIFDFNEEEFLAACESAIARVRKERINKAGLTLQETFSKEKFVENVSSIIQ
jgi:hypothetical protein